MSNIYTSSVSGQKWASFVFVADYNKTFPDVAMLVSKYSFDAFDEGGRWATGWNDVVKTVQKVCDKERCKVSFLRLSCHGNEKAFALGNSIFAVSNHKSWKSEVEKISEYFVPEVSFLTIDACQTGKNSKLLKLFSKALGGIDVRGYKENQSAAATSEDSGRGPFVTCKVGVCSHRPGF